MTNPVYRDAQWARVRKIVLARDGGQCQIGWRGCLGVANSVDHIVELEDGGARYDVANCQAACVPCNTRKRNLSARRRGGRSGRREW